MEAARSAIPFLKTKTDKYDVLYVNTPWSKLDTAKISRFPAKDLTKDNAAMFIWVDSYKAQEAMTVIDAWGFKFHSVYQIADVAQYAWMKKPATKKKDKDEEEAKEETKEEEPASKDDVKDKPPPSPKTRTPVVQKFKMPPISPPSWWPTEPESTLETRATTEQL